MGQQNLLISSCLTLAIFTVLSCKNKPAIVGKKTLDYNEQRVAPAHNSPNLPEQIQLKKAVFEFISYNDNGDYMLLTAKKGNQLYGFINDNNDDRSLLRGDLCEIQWKEDTIYIAGDGERPELADWVISIKKTKDGTSSVFRKEYGKELRYYSNKEETDYSESYLNESYLLVEYYIACSTNKSIRLAIQDKRQLAYSIEEQTKDNRSYTVLGIGTISEHQFNTIQWLYCDNENGRVYEYDLSTDKLIEFK